ncbi:MAG: hypothetical protein AAFY38_12390 [Pseudomonadota bacterium]
MASKDTVPVTLDIAGFYFSKTVHLPEGSTVEDLMKEVKKTTSSQTPSLDFDTETILGRRFVDSITIEHSEATAQSRQKDKTTGVQRPRVYPAGTYSNADEAVRFKDNDPDKPLIAVDRNKTGVMAWQYYVYDADGVDVNRKSGPRRIVPFSDPFTTVDADGNEQIRGLKKNDTVVWRLIMIRTRPDTGVRDKEPDELTLAG